jgi:four helix bundle protein
MENEYVSHRDYTDLEVYKTCRSLRKMVQIIVKSFPPEEKYSLKDQITRASRSVTANLAEGYGRFYYKENIAFCRKSRGSIKETQEHLVTAFDEGYITTEDLVKYKELVDQCAKLINGYIRYLKKEQPQKEEKVQKKPPKMP